MSGHVKTSQGPPNHLRPQRVNSGLLGRNKKRKAVNGKKCSTFIKAPYYRVYNIASS